MNGISEEDWGTLELLGIRHPEVLALIAALEGLSTTNENLVAYARKAEAALEAKTAEAVQWRAGSDCPICREEYPQRPYSDEFLAGWRAAFRWVHHAHTRKDGRTDGNGVLGATPDCIVVDEDWMNAQFRKLERERDEALAEVEYLRAALVELAPSATIIPTAEVVIDGDVFTWADLPDVLRRTRESLAEARREAKDQYIKRQAAAAALERVQSTFFNNLLYLRIVSVPDLNNEVGEVLYDRIQEQISKAIQGADDV